MASWKTITAGAAPAADAVMEAAPAAAVVAPARAGWKAITPTASEALTPAQEASLDEDTGASLGVRAAVGALEKAEDRKRALESYYGVGNVKAKGDDNFTFVNPETGRWTVYNPEGWLPDAGDFASILPEIGETVGAVGGAIGGAAAGTAVAPGIGTIGLGMAGAGAGAAAGREGTIGLVNWLSGQDDTRTWGEQGVDALQTAGLNAGGELIGPVARVGWNAGKKILSPAGYMATRGMADNAAAGTVAANSDRYMDSAFTVGQRRQMAFRDAGLEDASLPMDLGNQTTRGIGGALVRIVGASDPVISKTRETQRQIAQAATDLYSGGRAVDGLYNENELSKVLTDNANALVGKDGILNTSRGKLYDDLEQRYGGIMVPTDEIDDTLARMYVPKEEGGLNAFEDRVLLDDARYGGEVSALMDTVRRFTSTGKQFTSGRPRPRSGSFDDAAEASAPGTGVVRAPGSTVGPVGASADDFIDEGSVAPFVGRVDPYAGGRAADQGESAFGPASRGAGRYDFTPNPVEDDSLYKSARAMLRLRSGLKIPGADGASVDMVNSLKGAVDGSLDTALRASDPNLRLDLDYMGPVSRTYDAGEIVREAAKNLGDTLPEQGAFGTAPVRRMTDAAQSLLAKPSVDSVQGLEDALGATLLSPEQASSVAAGAMTRLGGGNAFKTVDEARKLGAQVRAKMIAAANQPERLAAAPTEASAFGAKMVDLIPERDFNRIASIRRYAEGESPLSDIRSVGDAMTPYDERAMALDYVDATRREALGAVNGSNTTATSDLMHRVQDASDVPSKVIRGDVSGLFNTAMMWAAPPLLGRAIGANSLKRAMLKADADYMAEQGFRETVSAFGNSPLGRAVLPSARRAMENQKARTAAAYERAGLLDDKWLKQGEVFDPLARNTGQSLESAFSLRTPPSERAKAISLLASQRALSQRDDSEYGNRSAFGN